MHISKIQIENFKSFHKSETINLDKGFNVIVGQNNSGKSALLEALSLNFGKKPHISNSYPNTPQVSTVNTSLTISKDELLEIIKKEMLHFRLPLPKKAPDTANTGAFKNFMDEQIDLILRKPDSFTFQVQIINNNQFVTRHNTFPTLDSYLSANAPDTQRPFVLIEFKDGDFYSDYSYQLAAAHEADFGLNVVNLLKERIFCFQAERLNVGESDIGTGTDLKSDCSNLPAVLMKRYAEDQYKEKLIKYVNLILPQIKSITLNPIQVGTGQRVEILIWNDKTGDRLDFTRRLKECGTGIGQVLSMLYVVTTAQFPKVIIIDEPQSFLHPAATKKLIDILRTDYPQHQYIVSSHSPEILYRAEPNQIISVTHDGEESKLDVIPLAEQKKLKSVFSELGISPMDVFGMDQILWVEGDTEEKCFPLIVEKLGHRILKGTVFIRLNPSDFNMKNNKNLKRVIDIYTKICQASALLPPALFFLLDDENRTSAEKEDIIRLFNPLKKFDDPKEIVDFLPRKMYENYLLHAEAISYQLNKYIKEANAANGENNPEIDADHVQQWIDKNRSNEKYWKGQFKSKSEDISIDAAVLLNDLFREKLNQKYEKTTDSVEITEWLIENEPEHLEVLKEVLINIVNKSKV